MSISKYETLAKVCELGSLTKAAEALEITQSAVSHTINSLEEQFGFAILTRSRAGVKLTDNGQRIQDFFALMGRETMLTRTSAASLADPDSTTLRQEKVSDTKNRVALINSVSGGSLISIHQNTLPGHPSVHGAQVFYGKTATSDVRARSVQESLNSAVNQGNEKASKPIGNDIYIMAHVSCPAILVECGFLSNPSEASLLTSEDYQNRLVWAIHMGVMEFLNGSSVDEAEVG